MGNDCIDPSCTSCVAKENEGSGLYLCSMNRFLLLHLLVDYLDTDHSFVLYRCRGCPLFALYGHQKKTLGWLPVVFLNQIPL